VRPRRAPSPSATGNRSQFTPEPPILAR
jgi:hypothetical protein